MLITVPSWYPVFPISFFLWVTVDEVSCVGFLLWVTVNEVSCVGVNEVSCVGVNEVSCVGVTIVLASLGVLTCSLICAYINDAVLVVSNGDGWVLVSPPVWGFLFNNFLYFHINYYF